MPSRGEKARSGIALANIFLISQTSQGTSPRSPGWLSQYPLPYRNGLPVQADGHRVHQSPDGTLLIHNLRPRDEGSYTCSAYRGSQAVSRSTEVKVALPGKGGLSLKAS